MWAENPDPRDSFSHHGTLMGGCECYILVTPYLGKIARALLILTIEEESGLDSCECWRSHTSSLSMLLMVRGTLRIVEILQKLGYEADPYFSINITKHKRPWLFWRRSRKECDHFVQLWRYGYSELHGISHIKSNTTRSLRK